MRKSYRGRKQTIKPTKEFKVNEKIFSQELFIIDEKGEQLGVMNKLKALAEARNRDLDLVEVSPKAKPPIAKFMDYGSFKYQKEKQERKAKSKNKTVEIKTVKISSRISQHDIEFRINQAVKFLEDGDKVKIELQLKGREHQHEDIAKENIQKIISSSKEKLANQVIKIEQNITKQGSKISAIIAIQN